MAQDTPTINPSRSPEDIAALQSGWTNAEKVEHLRSLIGMIMFDVKHRSPDEYNNILSGIHELGPGRAAEAYYYGILHEHLWTERTARQERGGLRLMLGIDE